MKKVKNIIQFLAVIMILSLMYQCANPVMPTGGPKDIYPPIPLRSEPQNHSVNFTSKKVEITFNEFFDLDNPAQNILISPPMSKQPLYKKRGKKLLIEFREDFKPNTTYSIFFGESIKDITEGNILNNYRYVFSTGQYLDSLGIGGEVIDAYTLEPQDGVYVMLYIDNNDTVPFDSLPYKVVPKYISRTNKQGIFTLSNLAEDQYKIFALKEENSNYIFDNKKEKIAFLDTLIQPEVLYRRKVDSLTMDSLGLDTMAVFQDRPLDSLDIAEGRNTFFKLYLFPNQDTMQVLNKAELVKKGLIRFSFAQPAEDVTIEALNLKDINKYKIEEFSRDKDTINWYLTNIPTDSLYLKVEGPSIKTDTVELSLLTKEERTRLALKQKNNKKEEKERKLPNISYSTNVNGGYVELNKNLELTFDYPLSKWDFSHSSLIVGEDTISAPLEFTDSIHRHLLLNEKMKAETSYQLIIPDSIMQDVRGSLNDSINLSFKTRRQEDYGVLFASIKLPEVGPDYILELTSENWKNIVTSHISQNQIVEYHYLLPGKYRLRLIKNTGGTDEWLTGNYGKKRQPEKVYLFEKVIEIRANWDVEESWNVSEE
ncbi:MAG: Ig-like domain-containing protein [Bacteroidales bacterium]